MGRLGWKQEGTQEVRNDEARRGGHVASPPSNLSHAPVPLHVPFPLPAVPLPSPSETSHLCFHGLLRVSHTPSTLTPKRGGLLPRPLTSFENGSPAHSALALIPHLPSHGQNLGFGVRPRAAQGPALPALAVRHLRKWLTCPEPQAPHLENGKTGTLPADAKVRTSAQ